MGKIKKAVSARLLNFPEKTESLSDVFLHPEVIAACDRLGMAMVFSGVRHFQHRKLRSGFMKKLLTIRLGIWQYGNEHR